MLLMLLVERRDLLARFKTGERRALEEVYRHYVADVANFLRRGFSFTSRERTFRFSGYLQPFDLDNAVQETFVRAFKDSARLGYDGLHSYKNYLLAIARNLVVDDGEVRLVQVMCHAAPPLPGPAGRGQGAGQGVCVMRVGRERSRVSKAAVGVARAAALGGHC